MHLSLVYWHGPRMGLNMVFAEAISLTIDLHIPILNRFSFKFGNLFPLAMLVMGFVISVFCVFNSCISWWSSLEQVSLTMPDIYHSDTPHSLIFSTFLRQRSKVVIRHVWSRDLSSIYDYPHSDGHSRQYLVLCMIMQMNVKINVMMNAKKNTDLANILVKQLTLMEM